MMNTFMLTQKTGRRSAKDSGKIRARLRQVTCINYNLNSFRVFAAVLACLLITTFGTSYTWGQAKEARSEEQDKEKLIQLGYSSLLVEALYGEADSAQKADLFESLVQVKQIKHQTKTVVLKSKTIKFIPMGHMGQKEFYEDVKASIKKLKKQGYIVFYEGISRPKNADSQTFDVLRRKMRKAVGISATSEMYSMLKMISPELVPQYGDAALGITSADINADINHAQFVQQYEKVYGPVILDSCDLATPLNALYTCGLEVEKESDLVVESFRNEYLAGMIKASTHPKILVIYGAVHTDPVINLLSQ